MSPAEARRGRTHDAEGAREAILNAAEQVFAEHGFDGARIDAIAKASGYNKSLIFQYFDDKLSLYGAVIRRVDDQTRDLQTEVLSRLVEEGVMSDLEQTRSVLRSFLSAFFDYLVAHPRLMRIFLWEMAEGWQTYAKILTTRDMEDVDLILPVIAKAQASGVLRSNYEPMAQMLLLEFIYPSFLAVLPLYQTMMPGADIHSPEALARARDFIVEFAIYGFLAEGQRRPQG